MRVTHGSRVLPDMEKVIPDERKRLAAGAAWYGGFYAGLLALALVACSSPSDPDERRVVAIVAGSATWTEGPPIMVSDTVYTAEPFGVEVVTFGTANCSRTGETEVVEGVGTVQITPYNYGILRDSCPRMYQELVHHLQLVAADPGSLILRVVGRDSDTDQLITLEKEVIVRDPGS